MKKIFLLVVFTLIVDSNSEAQTCGFGCLGLGGFYAGYGFQNINASGFDEYIESFNSAHSSTLTSPMEKFNRLSGFRVGANLIRTKYKGFLFSFKGYYQFLKEEKQAFENLEDRKQTTTFSLDLNYFGAGVDIGCYVLGFMDLKIVDAQITFHSADFKISTDPVVEENEFDYSNSKTGIGFSLGSGLIFHLVGDYISIETTAGYTKVTIDKMEDSNNNILSSLDGTNSPQQIENFINNGGFYGVVQLNIGIPLY